MEDDNDIDQREDGQATLDDGDTSSSSGSSTTSSDADSDDSNAEGNPCFLLKHLHSKLCVIMERCQCVFNVSQTQ